uniref:Uncharacterized protein n=1 Tax=Romanomermis culicivorax TaxID=13658 RepID=A0A915KGN5_ROMCU
MNIFVSNRRRIFECYRKLLNTNDGEDMVILSRFTRTLFNDKNSLFVLLSTLPSGIKTLSSISNLPSSTKRAGREQE